jgi:small conductance mechanosensitive channel
MAQKVSHFSHPTRFLRIAMIVCLLFITIAYLSDNGVLKANAQTVNLLPSQSLSASSDQAEASGRLLYMPTPSTDRQTYRVLNSLVEKAGIASDLSIVVSDGMVVIEGVADDRAQLQWLEKSANRLPFVVAVVNKAVPRTVSLSDFKPIMSETRRLLERVKRSLPNLLIAAALFACLIILGRFLTKGAQSMWKSRISNPFLLATVSRLSLWPVWIFFFYLILQAAGLQGLATTIIGGTGVLGLILGFAFKGIVENYLSGLLLAVRSPFTKGDLIQIGDHTGYVQNLNMRGTTIIDLDGNLILIPNSVVVQSVVQNKTVNPHTRSTFMVHIGYQDSITHAQDLILKAVAEVRGVLKDPAPHVVVEGLDPAGVSLKVLFWYDMRESSALRTKSRAIIYTKETLLAHGMSIPSDTRQLVFGDTLKIRVVESKEEAGSVVLDRKTEIIEQAAVNLEESRNSQLTPEVSQADDLMKLAEKRPLLNDESASDLLKP